ncbi:MAG TPA: class I SAM-dependent methyltransferase [Verrucomicrobiae bacterium]|nr:class I SAM-dependent methyltransferase [Verrucomicrobiae bacterium]
MPAEAEAAVVRRARLRDGESQNRTWTANYFRSPTRAVRRSHISPARNVAYTDVVPVPPHIGEIKIISDSVLRLLVCPRDHSPLQIQDALLKCAQGHTFAIEQGVPVFAECPRREPIPLNMPPLRQTEKSSAAAQAHTTAIDPFVNDWIVNTNGNLYWRMRGRLPRYPIPAWPFGEGRGRVLLDIGCGWGRWSIAAARAGFQPIGLDLHIDTLAAAARVSRQLNVHGEFLCSGIEELPLASRSVDCVFSYSVLQHIEKSIVLRSFDEIARVLKPDGTCIIQLPNKVGVVSIAQQLRRGFRNARPGSFEMRYWSHDEIRRALEAAGLRGVRIRADGFFSQNPQLADLDLLSMPGKALVLASYAGRTIANALPILTHMADSLWIKARAPE